MSCATIQTIVDSNASSGSSRQVTFDEPISTGNAVLVCVFWETNVTITSVTDSQSNTYVDCGAGRVAQPTSGYIQILGAKNITGGSSVSVTVNFSGATTGIDVYVIELYGAHTTTLFGQTATGTAVSGTSVTTSTFTPSYTNGMIVAFAIGDDTTGAVGAIAGNTPRLIAAPTSWSTALEEWTYIASLGSNITASINFSSSVTRAVIIAVEIQGTAQVYASSTALSTTSNGKFAINGVPTFLIGMTYFDAIDWHLSDLNATATAGFNLMRILLDKQWMDGGTGTESVFNSNGTIREDRMARIHTLIKLADERGIIVEVVIHVADGTPNTATWITTSGNRVAACTNAVAALKQHVNIMYDVVNEFNYGTAYDDEATELDPLVDAVFTEDATAIACASGAGSFSGLEWGLAEADDTIITADLTAILARSINVFAIHCGRQVDWYDRTGTRANTIRAYLNSVGRAELPIYFNEEAHVGSIFPPGTDPTAANMITAAVNARASSMAGYVMMSAANFDMATATMMSQFTAAETTAFNGMVAAITPLTLTADATKFVGKFGTLTEGKL